MSHSRVQFFDNEHSDSSSQLSQSRFDNLNQQLFQQVQGLFAQLKCSLDATQQRNEELKYIGQNAVDTCNALPSSANTPSSPMHRGAWVKHAADQVQGAYLDKLLLDYNRYVEGRITYEQFYANYGREEQNKKYMTKSNQLFMTTQQHFPKQVVLAKYMPVPITRPQVQTDDYVTMELRKAKRKLQEEKQNHSEAMANHITNYERRITALMECMHKDGILVDTQIRLTEESERNKELIIQQQEMRGEINALQDELRVVKESLRLYENSEKEEDGEEDKMYSSEVRTNHLREEYNLVKNQLLIERISHAEKIQSMKSQFQSKYSRVRGQLKEMQAQKLRLEKQIDKIRIQNSFLKKQEKIANSLKQNIQKQFLLKRQNQVKRQQENEKKSQISNVRIAAFTEKNLQGFNYYNELTKEFQTRFRKACLKQKELLYRENGIEIGVITTYTPPNTLQMCVHFTNETHETINNFQTQFIDSGRNVVSSSGAPKQIPAGKQVRQVVKLQAEGYPLGALVLKVQCGDKNQMRVLLPAHIFKMFDFEPTNSLLKEYKTVTFQPDTKVCRDKNTLMNYFGTSSLKILAFHRHTNTTLELGINLDQPTISYCCTQGSPLIADYFVKSLQFLLRK